MTINTFKECVDEMNIISEWASDIEARRERVLKFFPYSVVVHGYCHEYDMAEDWFTSQFGRKGGEWDECWYGKSDYSYGYCECFFKEKSIKDKFRHAVGSLSTELDVVYRVA
jgi:hypothetical protein